ncbi:MAG TPA: sigma-70 family RNA polymerase sigma factor [Fimbriimonadales bacterium]|nr:sigma-70 family RNA polymerase sigma factor [Fimbriimonadales bacterium]
MSTGNDFEKLVLVFERRLYALAMRLTGNPEESAEMVQETFVRAYKGWKKFRKESQTYTWLYRIMINLNKDRLARIARQKEREVPIEAIKEIEKKSESFTTTEIEPLKSVESEELQSQIQQAIDALPTGYKECLVLREVEGLTYQEIAEVMEITEEAVRSRLARARQQVRQRLAPYLKI